MHTCMKSDMLAHARARWAGCQTCFGINSEIIRCQFQVHVPSDVNVHQYLTHLLQLHAGELRTLRTMPMRMMALARAMFKLAATR